MTTTATTTAIRAYDLKVGDIIGTHYALTYVGPVDDGLIRTRYIDENRSDRARFFAFDEIVMVTR